MEPIGPAGPQDDHQPAQAPSSGPIILPDRKKKLLRIFFAVDLAIILAVAGWFLYLKPDSKDTPSNNQQSSNLSFEPSLMSLAITEGLSNIWDAAFPNIETAVITTREGMLYGVDLRNKTRWEIAKLDVRAEGEGGLLGITLDSKFSDNRYAYVCYNASSSPLTVRVARFKLAEDNRSILEQKDIIADIESQAGRHSGCRMTMGKDEVLWVGTGDSALRTAAQNPKSLAGKILRVDRDGKGVEGNLSDPFDPRIYSYGHRNTQGIVLFDQPAPNGALGLSAEHGSSRDDEINWLLPGNFGWDPATDKGNYDESVPMTDSDKYPDAVPAIWSSGKSTIAVSGLSTLKHEKWGNWRGRVVMAVLKDKHVRLISFAGDGKIESEEEILKDFGRVRSVNEALDGNLYITTDNGKGQDKLIRITPQ